MADAVAHKGSNTGLTGALIPYYSTIAYGLSNDGLGLGTYPNFSAGYGSTTWRNGVEIGGTANGTEGATVYYGIYSDTATQGITGDSLPVLWAVTSNSSASSDILTLINSLPARMPYTPFGTFEDGMGWIKDNGYLPINRNYPNIGFNDPSMKVALDVTHIASYPWYGERVYDLVGTITSSCSSFGDVVPTVNTANGSTPYFAINHITPNGFVGMTEDFVSCLSGYTYVAVSIWIKPDSFSGANNTILYMSDDGSFDKKWLWIYTDKLAADSIVIEGDPTCSGLRSFRVGDGSLVMNTGSFYCVTIVMDFNATGTLYTYISSAGGSFGDVSPGSSYSMGTSSTSLSVLSNASSIGARIAPGPYSSISYFSEGFNSTFGSVHTYAGNSEFTSAMAEQIFLSTKSIYL